MVQVSHHHHHRHRETAEVSAHQRRNRQTQQTLLHFKTIQILITFPHLLILLPSHLLPIVRRLTLSIIILLIPLLNLTTLVEKDLHQ